MEVNGHFSVHSLYGKTFFTICLMLEDHIYLACNLQFQIHVHPVLNSLSREYLFFRVILDKMFYLTENKSTFFMKRRITAHSICNRE